jgi:7-cyano-7-deazaguanosine (preQ0) biosynthesis protein QueE
VIISEIFGPTVQGEGPALGKRCGFVRLGRCNLACEFCDTAYSWDWSRYDAAEQLSEMSVDEVRERVASMEVDTVVFTGGEPLLQQRELVTLFGALGDCNVHVETAGTLAWDDDYDLVDQWVVSPKLANSGMPEARRLKFDVLEQFAKAKASFKFVVTSVEDLDEIAAIVERVGIANTHVWVMPEGTAADVIVERTAALADAVVARRWNLTTRLHVLAWGNQRAH